MSKYNEKCRKGVISKVITAFFMEFKHNIMNEICRFIIIISFKM